MTTPPSASRSADAANLIAQIPFSDLTVVNQGSGSAGSTMGEVHRPTRSTAADRPQALCMVEVTNAYVPVSAEALTMVLNWGVSYARPCFSRGVTGLDKPVVSRVAQAVPSPLPLLLNQNANQPYVSFNFASGQYSFAGQSYSSFLSIPTATFTRASTGTATDCNGNIVSLHQAFRASPALVCWSAGRD